MSEKMTTVVQKFEEIRAIHGNQNVDACIGFAVLRTNLNAMQSIVDEIGNIEVSRCFNEFQDVCAQQHYIILQRQEYTQTEGCDGVIYLRPVKGETKE